MSAHGFIHPRLNRVSARVVFNSGTAFTLIELLVVIAIVAILLAILLTSIASARRTARVAVCTSNLDQFATAQASYANDFQDRIAAFSPDGLVLDWTPPTNDPIQAAADQAVDIMRRRGEREDIQRITSWTPYVFYCHLILNDYLAQRLPEPMVVCPEDRVRLQWQRDPVGFESLSVAPSDGSKRWPYSSSYELVAAACGPDRAPTFTQGPDHKTIRGSGSMSKLGSRRFSEIAFASQKVDMFDTFDRHFRSGPDLYHAYEQAKQPILFFDGSVRVKRTAEANPGFRPGSPNAGPTRYDYAPDLKWEPPCRNGEAREAVTGYFRWTREGLGGIDFGGGEVSR